MRKFNKHILEAIQRGIQLALDDYEDSTSNTSIMPKRNTIKNNNSVKDLIRIHEKFIDLGLPSGTLWAKNNLEHGKTYAWGEVEPRYGDFTQSNYLFANGESAIDKIRYKKYVTEEKFAFNGNIDNLTELQLSDDAAYQVDHEYRIPTKEQLDELVEYTTHIFQDTGITFKSNINDAEMFVPYSTTSNNNTNYCLLWSSTLRREKCDGAYGLEANRTQRDIKVRNLFRFYGFQIRPVYNDRN